jgi:hypothetical protein
MIADKSNFIKTNATTSTAKMIKKGLKPDIPALSDC